MSGIAGAVSPDGRPETPGAMVRALEHRAPATLEGGIAADARLDNRPELIHELGLEPSATDAGLIRAAYARWGEDCPARLLGDFAFAVWDERRRAIFAARDPFGVKPFYYHASPRRPFAFASEIKALLALPEVPRRLNESRVADYLLSSLDEKAETFYRDIRRLPPGHSLIAGAGGVSLRRHWSLDPARELRLGSDAEYVEAFRGIFLEAVRCRLRGASPAGAFLSGGLDSSSVACAAARELRGVPLHTFSATFEGVPESDERPYMEAVLARGGFAPHFVRLDDASPFEDLDRILRHEDEPYFSDTLSMDWALYREARRAGVGVVLEGFDGDTTVSHGLAFLSELLGSGRWIEFLRELGGVCRHLSLSPWRVFLHRAVRPMVPRFVRRPWRRPGLLRADFARRVGAPRAAPAPAAREREDHRRLLEWGGMTFGLEVTDRAAAAFGVEPRFPFFDRRLAEFCLALPPRQKVRGGWTRLILRRAMEGIVPEKVRWREDKADIGVPFARALLRFERERLREAIEGSPGVLDGFVDMGLLRETFRRYTRGGRRGDAGVVWRAATLALWLKSTGITP